MRNFGAIRIERTAKKGLMEKLFSTQHSFCLEHCVSREKSVMLESGFLLIFLVT